MSGESGTQVNAPQDSLDAAHSNGSPNLNPFKQVYELGREIGKGGFGSVHIASCLKSGDEFAIKVIIRSKLNGNDDDIFREIKILRELKSHPNIVSLVDFFACPEIFNIVLELAQGGDLFDKLAKLKNYTERDARYVAKDILTAISFIHSKGFVHRDMKPENLLIGKNTIKVADFGFAKNMSDAPTPAGLVSRCGTPAYVSPEFINCNPHGKPVDIWACGVILYILLGGYQPFQGPERQLLFRKIRAGDYEFHNKYWGLVSVEAKQLITRMLTIDPKARITANDALNSSWMSIDDTSKSISSRNLDSTIKGIRKFNAKRKLKGLIHMANFVKKLHGWDPDTLSFMPEDTTAVSTNSESKILDNGKIGQKFDDIYSLVSEVKARGNTIVWKGVQKKSKEEFAIKIIKRNNSTSDDAMVLNEVAILQSLRHKYVVKMHNYFEESSRFLLVLEFMQGGDVLDRILKISKYTEKDARGLSKALLSAIEYIHSCKIAHRDLKPQNLLLETKTINFRIKVADFGYAKRVHTPLSLMTQCGTPTYIAPEILKNHPYDESADMWSVGVIIYVLLIGYPPFMEGNQRDLIRKIRQGEYGFKGKDWGGISRQAKDMIRSLLVVDTTRRYSAKKALQHEWICMDDYPLKRNSLLGSQRVLRTSLKKLSSNHMGPLKLKYCKTT